MNDEGRINLVDRVKVGNIVYTVKYEPKLIVDGVWCMGHASFDDAAIQIAGDQSEESMQSTLLHEIFHAMLYFMGHKDSGDDSLVDLLARGFHMIIRDNPGLINHMAWKKIEGSENAWNPLSGSPDMLLPKS